MMYTAIIENNGGESLTLTQSEDKWQIISITGLNPPQALINMTDIAGMDGSMFNSSKLQTRNIVILLQINGNVEENRHELYRFFRTKEACKFYFKNASRDLYIDGYIENVECDLFSNGEQMQISIICPDPYFKSISETQFDLSDLVALFKFPFSINIDEPIPISSYIAGRITTVINSTEADTGMMINVTFLDDASKISVINTLNGEYITVNYPFVAGDKLMINTKRAQKSVYVIHDGEQINIFPYLDDGSTFLQLDSGANYFRYSVDDGSADQNVILTFTFNLLYRGV